MPGLTCGCCCCCSYWRELSRELQLRQGGALSIAEILGRMRDGAQLKLQAAERELCLTLNVLADKVAAQADEAAAAVAGSSPKQQQQQQQLPSARRKRGNSKKGRRARAADATAAAASDSDGCDSHDDSYESAAAAAGSSQQAISTKKPKKRVRFDADAAAGADSNGDLPGASGAGSSRRRSSSDASLDDGQSVDEMRQTALKLLEDSYKVGSLLLVFACSWPDVGCADKLVCRVSCSMPGVLLAGNLNRSGKTLLRDNKTMHLQNDQSTAAALWISI